jgi:hypothetical protein
VFHTCLQENSDPGSPGSPRNDSDSVEDDDDDVVVSHHSIEEHNEEVLSLALAFSIHNKQLLEELSLLTW